jgi:hypothetical protein
LAVVVGVVGLGKSVLQIGVVFFAKGSLAFAVQVQQVAEIFS